MKKMSIRQQRELNPVIEKDIEAILGCDINFKKLENSTILRQAHQEMFGTYMLYTLTALNDLRSII